MNRQQFYNLVDNPHLLNDDTLKQLGEVIVQYPFFQTARMLLIKNLHNLEHIRFNSELKICAAHIANRSALYDLVYRPQQDVATGAVVEPVESVEEAGCNDDVVGVAELPVDSKKTAEDPVPEVKDYFDVSDELPTLVSSVFTVPSEPMPVGEILPSADLLEYDMPDSVVSYSVEAELPDVDLSDDSIFSFSDWLNHMKHRNVTADGNNGEQSKATSLIDNFLKQESHRIVPRQPEISVKIEDKVKQSVSENEDLLTETLASIYIKQKHFQKAVNIFEKLRLKYPEKNTYFASRISEIEKMSNTQ